MFMDIVVLIVKIGIRKEKSVVTWKNFVNNTGSNMAHYVPNVSFVISSEERIPDHIEGK